MNKWSKVFGFTFKNAVKTKGFLGSTIGIALLLFLLLGGMNVFFGYSSDEEEEQTAAEQVWVVNQTTIQNPDVSLLNAANPAYADVKFTLTESVSDSKLTDSEAVVTVAAADTGALQVTVLSAEETEIGEGELEEIGNMVGSLFQSYAALEAGVSQQGLAELNFMVSTQVKAMGEAEKSLGQTLFEMFAPMILYFVLYMMLITYGQSIGKVIIAEKASKLMELLLTSVKPYAVIMGKIMAMVAVAIMQFSIWIASGILGFVVGDRIAQANNPEYDNLLLDLIDLVKESGAGSAFSLGAAITAVLVLFLGFTFYCIFVGQVTAFVGKAEELSSLSGAFVLPMVISFFLAYFLPLLGTADWLMPILRYIPFTGAFLLPADVMLGNITIVETVIPIIILVAVSAIMVYTTGKVYKKKIFA